MSYHRQESNQEQFCSKPRAERPGASRAQGRTMATRGAFYHPGALMLVNRRQPTLVGGKGVVALVRGVAIEALARAECEIED